MPRHHLFLFLFGISAFLVSCTVGREVIIGGKKANPEQFPYVVSVNSDGKRKNVGYSCGGGIISDLLILTAANCVIVHQGRFRSSPMFVVAGTIDMNRRTEPAVVVPVKKVFAPNEYSPPQVITGDIAILKLLHRLDLSRNSHLKPLNLPKNRREPDSKLVGEKAEIAGWSSQWIRNGTGGVNDSILRYVESEVIASDRCQEVFDGRRNITIQKELCATTKHLVGYSKSGVCQDDTGRPLVHNGTVIGILIHTLSECSEPDYLAIYTRVSYYLPFIDKVMKNKLHSSIREKALVTN